MLSFGTHNTDLRLNDLGVYMKYSILFAALFFAGSAAAVDCVECHESIDVAMHTENEATLAVCADCHAIGDAHEIDMEMHSPELTMKECTDCHQMEK
jgi:NAD-dependent SIR2 family protein deacetylase